MEMEEMDLLEYWRILMKRKWLIIALFIIAVITAAVVSLMMDPVYEATTTLMVNETSLANMTLLDSLATGSRNKVMNYVQILKSRQILLRVLDQLGMSHEDYSSVANSITVQPIQGTEILKVSMQSTDPKHAQLFVNTLAQVFLEWNRDSKREEKRSAREFVEGQLKTVSSELRQAEERLLEYREKEKTLSPSEEILAALDQVSAFETQLAETTISRVEIENRKRTIEAQLSEEKETLISATTISENPFVSRYRDRLADLEVELSGARERYTERHPTVLALQAEIADIRNKLTEQVERVVSTETRTANPIHRELYGQLITLQVELVGLDAREQALNSLKAKVEESFLTLPTKELELARLVRDTKVLEEIYVMLMETNEEIRISEAMQIADVLVIDSAILPESPIKPQVRLNIAIAGVLGLFVGTGIAFLLEYIDTTIKTKEQAEALLGLPVLGQIPYFESGALKEPDRPVQRGQTLGRG